MTGGTGVLGPGVVRQLAAAGHDVRVLVRQPPSPGLLPETVTSYVGDVTDPASLHEACANVGTVVHLAGLLHVSRAPEAEYLRTNVGGTTNLLDAAKRSGVRRFLLASTIAVYGYNRPGRSNEDTPPIPDTPYGRSKLSAERAALSAQTEHLLVGILRLAAVYGPSMRGNYRRLLEAMAAGRFVPVGRGRNLRTLVYQDDAAAAFVMAAEHPGIAGRVYNVTDGECHSVTQIVEALARALGRRSPRVFVPVPLARARATLMEAGAGLAGRSSPVSVQAVEKYVEQVAVAGDRIQRDLGFRPRVGLDEGWHSTVDALKRAGALGGARELARSVS